MIDVGLSVFRLKGAMSKCVHVSIDISLYFFCDSVLSFTSATMPRLISYFNRVEDGGGEGRRRTGNLSLASVAAGHSLVAPCGLENSKEAGGVSQGGGEGTPSQSSTGCNRAGRRKWLACGRVFDYWDVRGGCQWSSTCAHVNRTEGGVRPQAKTPSGVRHCDVTALLMVPLIDSPSPPPH